MHMKESLATQWQACQEGSKYFCRLASDPAFSLLPLLPTRQQGIVRTGTACYIVFLIFFLQILSKQMWNTLKYFYGGFLQLNHSSNQRMVAIL
jgi:hypothetical protein